METVSYSISQGDRYMVKWGVEHAFWFSVCSLYTVFYINRPAAMQMIIIVFVCILITLNYDFVSVSLSTKINYIRRGPTLVCKVWKRWQVYFIEGSLQPTAIHVLTKNIFKFRRFCCRNCIPKNQQSVVNFYN